MTRCMISVIVIQSHDANRVGHKCGEIWHIDVIHVQIYLIKMVMIYQHLAYS